MGRLCAGSHLFTSAGTIRIEDLTGRCRFGGRQRPLTADCGLLFEGGPWSF
jgi:hypothetical protein